MPHWIRTKLATFGDRSACHERGRAFSYTDFLELIEQAATKLPASSRQVIEVQAPTTLEGLATLLAIAERGHIALPLPAELPEAAQSKMRTIAANSPLYSRLTNSGLILFSSGSTGEPKGMLHSFDALLGRYRNISFRQDRSLLLLLIDHIGGLDSAFRCLFAGSTLVIPEARTPEAAGKAIAAHKVNVLPASPTFLNLMLRNGIAKNHDLSSVEIIAYGAEAMQQSVLQRLAEAFPQAQLQQKFGTSETGAIRIKSAENNSLFFRIDDKDTQWKIVNGILWLKTPSRILGYLNANQDNLEAQGWYATGDLVEVDEQQNIRIIGRREDLINVGGEKVTPSEIESILLEIPEIADCMIYGEANAITGQNVAAEVVAVSGVDLKSLKRTIKKHCRAKLSPYKVPARIVFSDSTTISQRHKKVRISSKPTPDQT